MKQYWACVGLLAVISSFTMGQEVVVVEEGGAVAADAAADEGMTDLPTTKAPRGNVKARSKRMTDLYLRTYGKHLEKNDWITRAMAVVSLCRIHDSRVVEQLLKTLQGDPDPRVRAYAWEALRMRDGDLTKEQRADWLQQGRMLVSPRQGAERPAADGADEGGRRRGPNAGEPPALPPALRDEQPAVRPGPGADRRDAECAGEVEGQATDQRRHRRAVGPKQLLPGRVRPSRTSRRAADRR